LYLLSRRRAAYPVSRRRAAYRCRAAAAPLVPLTDRLSVWF